MSEEKNLYCYSFDQEIYHGRCSSIEDAIEESKEDGRYAESEIGEEITVMVGIAVAINARQVFPDADYILDYIKEQLYDMVGEVADGFDPAYPSQLSEIDKELPDVIKSLFMKHGVDLNVETYYTVSDVKEFKLIKQ